MAGVSANVNGPFVHSTRKEGGTQRSTVSTCAGENRGEQNGSKGLDVAG